MNIRLILGAVVTALATLFSGAPERIAQRLSGAGTAELSGRVTAVEADAVRLMVAGQGEVELQLDEDTQFLETRPAVTPKGRPCVDIDRSAAGSDLAAGQEITVTYEDEDGVIYVRTLTVIPKPCDAPSPPPLRDGAGEPQPAADAGSSRTGADVSADVSLDVRAESSGTDAGVTAEAEADADASAGGLIEWIGSLLGGGN